VRSPQARAGASARLQHVQHCQAAGGVLVTQVGEQEAAVARQPRAAQRVVQQEGRSAARRPLLAA